MSGGNPHLTPLTDEKEHWYQIADAVEEEDEHISSRANRLPISPGALDPSLPLPPFDSRSCGKRKMKTQDQWKQLALRLLPSIIPSFLHGLVPGTRRPSPSTKPLHPSASLDGLRGLASFGVYILHFTYTFGNQHDWVWGTGPGPHWFQLPFINAFWRGPALVACFFIISGYVLSLKPLKQIRSRSDLSFLQTMSSAIFRRGIRLYIPTLVVTWVTMLLVWMGAFEPARRNYHDGWSIFMVEEPPYNVGNLTGQIDHWRHSIAPLFDFWFLDEAHSEYEPHLWTIPFEFRGSMLIFLFTVGIGAMSLPVRIVLEQAMIIYHVTYGRQSIVLFFLGLHLAELHLLLTAYQQRRQLINSESAQPLLDQTLDVEKNNTQPDSTTSPESVHARVISICIFTLGVFLTGMPFVDAHLAYGYNFFLCIVPSTYFWQCVGPLMIIITALLSPLISTLFTYSVIQYLGKISYALYIVHGNVRRLVTFGTMPAVWHIVGGNDTNTNYACGVILAFLINFLVTIWLADIVWRAVDEKSVRFARWVEDKCRRSIATVQPPQQPPPQ